MTTPDPNWKPRAGVDARMRDGRRVTNLREVIGDDIEWSFVGDTEGFRWSHEWRADGSWDIRRSEPHPLDLIRDADPQPDAEGWKSHDRAAIKHMVDRFLQWKLPKNFSPDAGIRFEPEYNVEFNAKRGMPPARHEPVGTNLFDATQATEMVEFMLAGLPIAPSQQTEAAEDEAYELGKRDGYEEAIQELDIATGGDGEFKGSTFPGETVDVPVMRQRILDRLVTPSQPSPVVETGPDEPKRSPLGWYYRAEPKSRSVYRCKLGQSWERMEFTDLEPDASELRFIADVIDAAARQIGEAL